MKLTDSNKPISFAGEVERAVQRHKPSTITLTEPGEWRVLSEMRTWAERFGVPVDIRADEPLLRQPHPLSALGRGAQELPHGVLPTARCGASIMC